MGFLKKIGKAIFGETKTTRMKAPPQPFGGLAAGFASNLDLLRRDPLRSTEFKSFKSALGSVLASTRRSLLDAVDFGAPLQSGARGVAQRGAAAELGGIGAQATGDFLSRLFAQRDQSFANLLATTSQYRASTFGSEVASQRTVKKKGLLDYVNDISNTVSNVTGAMNGLGGIFPKLPGGGGGG